MFYTRIPCPKNITHDPDYLNKATRYFPFIGWIVGSISFLAYSLFAQFLSTEIAAILAIIASIAPMFGFLGTVTGMIRTFHNISISNKIDISTIAAGIYEKMVTSASGLIVGIIAYVLYTLLTTMIDRTINKMEITAIDFLDILHKPASKS